MKTPLLLAAAFIALLPAATRAAEDAAYSVESKGCFETFSTKIVKVYSAQDGDCAFVAYVVIWKDREVVVMPYRPAPDAKVLSVGDTVRCFMQQEPAPAGSTAKGRIRFTLLGDGADTSGFSPVDEARLESVAAEVRARRAKRELSAGKRPAAPEPAPAAEPAKK